MDKRPSHSNLENLGISRSNGNTPRQEAVVLSTIIAFQISKTKHRRYNLAVLSCGLIAVEQSLVLTPFSDVPYFSALVAG
jgi:hypothetical protein